MSMIPKKNRLRDVFEMPKEQTMKMFHDRMVSIPVPALSDLKRELIASIGEERSKGVFIRYGWHTDVSEGEKVRNFEWQDETELVEAGPKFHVMHGHVEKVVIDDIQFDDEGHTDFIKALWYRSYEVEKYKQKNVVTDKPVCHTLCGYASGYLSTALQRTILVKETKCEAMGHDHCEIVCMPLEKWGGEDRDEHKYYQSSSMIEELDAVTAKLKEERDYLNKAHDVHKQLIEELLSKQELQKIIDLLYDTTGLPTFIENDKHRIMAQSAEVEIDFDLSSFDTETTSFCKISEDTAMLRTPILFENKIKGYCSFIYRGSMQPNDLEFMVIDQASLTASIVLLNENIKIQTSQNIRRGFLNDILDNRLDKEELYKVASYLEFEPESDYLMLTFERAIDEDELSYEVELNEKFLRFINFFLQERRINGFASQKSGQIITVIDHSSLKAVYPDQRAFIEKILKDCSSRLNNHTFFVGVSSVSDTINELPNLYRETLTALNVKSDEKHILYYNDLGVESILFQISDNQILDRFVENQLGELLQDDKSQELISTLKDYIENGMNINATAKAISMSISGLRYRLTKVSDLLGVELDDTKSLFSVYMALNVLKAKGRHDL
ncbi:XylR N-terminal domain-containing protein [Salinicoccus carnicancri]|uniref:XylR N-terminal domain-containing protein n=1 Tax=Salinicoccus carnicancri TaxID=558170 RepID=UPI000307D3E9|nr:XylR N-terminal domain-containing protein [Salinicoccus carnicancri]